MAEEKFLKLNVAFVIPADVAKVAMDLSSEIAEKEAAIFVLDGVEYLPHATIYPGEFPVKNLEEMENTLEIIAHELSPVEMVFKYNKAENGWLGPNFEYSQEIRKIQETVVEAINPLREGRIREKHQSTEYLTSISNEQRRNVEKYGYPNLLDLYEPHLTLIKLQDLKMTKKVSSQLDWKIKSFVCDELGLFVSGENGTCRKLIKRFKLKKPILWEKL